MVDMKQRLQTVGACMFRAVAFGLELRSFIALCLSIYNCLAVLLSNVGRPLTVHNEHFSRQNEGPNSCFASLCRLLTGVSVAPKKTGRPTQGNSKYANQGRPEAFQVYGNSGNAARQFQARYRRLWPLHRPKVGGTRQLQIVCVPVC